MYVVTGTDGNVVYLQRSSSLANCRLIKESFKFLNYTNITVYERFKGRWTKRKISLDG